MSHKATLWAMEQRGLSAAQFRVLMVLADHHNPTYGCFPKQETLAPSCEMSERTVRECLSGLEEMGLITRERISGRFGQRVGTRYFLAFETLPEDSSAREPTGKIASSLPAESRNPYRQNLPVYKNNLVKEPVREPVNYKKEKKGSNEPKKKEEDDLFERETESLQPEEPPSEPSSQKKEGARELVPITEPDFDRFWQAYPKHVGKAEAIKAFKKAIKKATVDMLLSGLERSKAFDSRFRSYQYTPAAGPWLNQERWKDEFSEQPHDDRTRSQRSFDDTLQAFDLADQLVRQRTLRQFGG